MKALGFSSPVKLRTSLNNVELLYNCLLYGLIPLYEIKYILQKNETPLYIIFDLILHLHTTHNCQKFRFLWTDFGSRIFQTFMYKKLFQKK